MGQPQHTVDSIARDQDYAALISQIASGDHQAVSTLYDSTSRLVFGLTLRILGDRSSAEEVCWTSTSRCGVRRRAMTRHVDLHWAG